MSMRAARSADAPSAANAAGLAAIALGAAAGAAAIFGIDPVVIVAGVVGAGAAITILHSPEWGLYAVAAFAILRLSDVASDYHGAPSTMTPLLGLIVLALAARWLAAGERPTGGGRAMVLIGTWLLIAASTLILASEQSAGVDALSRVSRDAIVAVLVGLLLHRGAALRGVAWVLVVGGGVLGALTTFQFLTGTFGSAYLGFAQSEIQNIIGATDDYRVAGPVGDPNFFAQWMLMVLPFAIDRVRAERALWLRVTAAGAAVVTTSAVVFTFSRGAVLGLGAVGLIYVILHPPKLRTVGALALVGVLALPFLPPGYVERLTTLGQVGTVDGSTDVSIRGRTAEMRAALEMFEDHPFTGVGFGTYAENYVDYSRRLGIEQRLESREAHNLYLEVAAETGIPGVIAFGAIIVLALRSVVITRRRFLAGGREDLAGLGLAVGASLVAYLVTSVFLHLAFSRPFWLIVGIALALPAVARHELPAPAPRSEEPAWL